MKPKLCAQSTDVRWRFSLLPDPDASMGEDVAPQGSARHL